MAEGSRSVTTRRLGYGIAMLVNAAMIVVVNNILEWGWFSWLTDDFELLLPLINLSLMASILVNLAYIVYDAAWFKTLCEIGLLIISLTVAIRTLQVFPFDFAAYSWDWEATTRMIIVIAIIGMSIGLIVNAVKLITILIRTGQMHQPSH